MHFVVFQSLTANSKKISKKRWTETDTFLCQDVVIVSGYVVIRIYTEVYISTCIYIFWHRERHQPTSRLFTENNKSFFTTQLLLVFLFVARLIRGYYPPAHMLLSWARVDLLLDFSQKITKVFSPRNFCLCFCLWRDTFVAWLIREYYSPPHIRSCHELAWTSLLDFSQ